MESNEVEEFDPSELLVPEEDPFLNREQFVHVRVKSFVDEDGDNAIQVGLSAQGLSRNSVLTALLLAYEVARGEWADG